MLLMIYCIYILYAQHPTPPVPPLDFYFALLMGEQTFQKIKPDERKVQLDDRFKAVLTDPRFQISAGESRFRKTLDSSGVDGSIG